MKSNNSILNHTYIIMKNKIIALLKDETLQKIEVYNQLLGYLSKKRGLFAIRNFQNGYSVLSVIVFNWENPKELIRIKRVI